MRAPALALLAALALPYFDAGARTCEFSAYASDAPIQDLCPLKEGLARIKVGGRWGFVDRAGQMAIAPQFEYVEDFAEGYAVAWEGDLKGFIDRRGNWAVPAQFDSLGPFSGGMAAARRPYSDADPGQAGYIDPAGKWVIAPTFATGHDFNGAVALVSDRAGYLFIDRKGRLVKRVPPRTRVTLYDNIGPLTYATRHADSFLLNLDGRRLPMPPGADPDTYFKQHLVAEKEVDHGDHLVELKGLVDLKGKWIIAPSFTELRPFFGKLAIASAEKMGSDGKQAFGLVDMYGQFVAPPAYANIVRELDGSFRARRAADAGKVDTLDQDGKLLSTRDCPPASEDRRCNNFVDGPAGPVPVKMAGANGLTPAGKDIGWGLVDKHGAWVVPPTLPGAPQPMFRDGKLIGWSVALSTVNQDERGLDLSAWLDPAGNLIAGRAGQHRLRYDRASNTLIVNEDGRFDSVISTDGAVRIKPLHAALKPLGDGWFAAEPRPLHGLLDQRGEWRIGPDMFDMSVQFGWRNGGARPYMIQRKGDDRELMDLHGRMSTRAAPRELGQEEPSDSWWVDYLQPHETTGYTVFNGFNFKPRVRVAGETLATEFSEGVIGVKPSDPKLAGHLALVDDTGKTLGLYRHESIERMRDGMAVTGALVATDVTRYGYLDRAGKLAIAPRFERAGGFTDRRATVVVDQGLAMIDKTGQVMLQGAWLCGKERPAILDGRKNVIWPKGAGATEPCAPTSAR